LSTENLNSDFVIITGLKSGDHASFKKLFDLYSKPLYRFSYSYLKSKEDAEGVVQEVFIKVWNRREQLKTNTSFKSYLFTIAINSIRKQFHKQARFNQVKHDILFDLSEDKFYFDDRDDYQALLDKLEELVQQMPEKRRQVFIKRKIEEKSLKAISEELSISIKTVEYHITESMKFLKKEFDKLHIKGMVFFHLFINEG